MGWFSRLLGRTVDFSSQEQLSPKDVVPDDWANSKAHLALLQRFLSLRDARSGVPDFWESMFGTHPRNVVEAMLKLNVLEPAPPIEIIEFCHTGAELKKLLASRGLKVSGKKADQAQRLLEADPEGMSSLYAQRKIVRCTPATRQIVEAWVDQQAQTLHNTIDQVIATLQRHQLKAAIQIADAYRTNRFEVAVHPVREAMTIKQSPKSLEDRTAEWAKIFKMRPKILKGLQPAQWEGLYVNYAVWQLIGRTAPEKCMPGFTGIGAMDETTVTRMMAFYVGHQRDLEQWGRLGIKQASISCCNSGSCDACMALDKKAYRLDKLPELPYAGCTCALGCRCLYRPDLGL
jgi:hypothetical protein